MTVEQWFQAAEKKAGDKEGRGMAQALRDPNVHRDVKDGIRMMSIVSARIPGTPAERSLQQKQLTWQSFAHGMPVAFGTPNVETRYNAQFAALAQPPGEGSLVDEWTLGPSLVCLSDLRPALQKQWLD